MPREVGEKNMNKFVKATDGSVLFHCPGCDHTHGFPVDGSRGWTWNGDLVNPTVSPSILVRRNDGDIKHVCHSFVKDGHIQFLGDCTHALAGQTVEIPAWESIHATGSYGGLAEGF